MQVRQFIQQAREIEELRCRYPGVEVRLNGLGLYAPVFTAEQWEHYWTTPTPGAISPDDASPACRGRSSDHV
jgi:hypothetical protein